MKRKFIWLSMSCLMVVALILVSCQPTPTEPTVPAVPEEEEEEVEVEAGPEMVTDALGRLVEKPQYGGTLTIVRFDDFEYFGPRIVGKTCLSYGWVNDTFMMQDYAKGPSGTGETSMMYYLFPKRDVLAGRVVESWELEDDVTLVYKIRQGIHFHNKPPANGREVDASDVVASWHRGWTEPVYWFYNYPVERVFDLPLEEAISARDKWTVVIKAKEGWTGQLFEKTLVHYQMLLPKELCGEDTPIEYFADWKNAIGSGPFLITDHVPMSSASLEKNPDYWMKHPLFPEDQIPYVDAVKWVIMPDPSTRLAALRAGKIDWLGGMRGPEGAVSWEEGDNLIQTNPELKYVERLINYGVDISFRMDKEELPFDDIRVRQALNMAINRQEILDTFHGGRGALLTFPIAPIPDLMDVFIPLEDYPQEVRETYEYNPEKAKQLLADAGYPGGFKTSIVCHAPMVDLLSIVKEYFADIGVDMELDIREYSVFRTIGVSKKEFPELYSYGVSSNGYSPWWWGPWVVGGSYNFSQVNDPLIVPGARENVEANYWDEPAKFAAYRELIPYMLSQAWYVPLPDPMAYTFWQPWLKCYGGELDLGYYQSRSTWAPYVWIDQDLKYELTGRK